MSLIRKSRKKAEINIVPLVDVLMVLIFFFLMTMQFRNVNVLNITPPEIQTAGKNLLNEQILIGISTEGQFYLNNQEVPEAVLKEALKIAGEANAEQPVLLVSDEETPLKHVTKVLDMCRSNKLNRIRMKSR
ncbi:MAG TPA: biopolymer transporter ExbD [Opitutales bacterium]|nr:biopolymer transporter ExbD [Opitutales bacterium]HOO91986.1 biopolymer transporter ExbD [Opitutales bacterium]